MDRGKLKRKAQQKMAHHEYTVAQNAIKYQSQQKKSREDDAHSQSEMETEIRLSQNPTVMEGQQQPNRGLPKQQARIMG